MMYVVSFSPLRCWYLGLRLGLCIYLIAQYSKHLAIPFIRDTLWMDGWLINRTLTNSSLILTAFEFTEKNLESK